MQKEIYLDIPSAAFTDGIECAHLAEIPDSDTQFEIDYQLGYQLYTTSTPRQAQVLFLFVKKSWNVDRIAQHLEIDPAHVRKSIDLLRKKIIHIKQSLGGDMDGNA